MRRRVVSTCAHITQTSAACITAFMTSHVIIHFNRQRNILGMLVGGRLQGCYPTECPLALATYCTPNEFTQTMTAVNRAITPDIILSRISRCSYLIFFISLWTLIIYIIANPSTAYQVKPYLPAICIFLLVMFVILCGTVIMIRRKRQRALNQVLDNANRVYMNRRPQSSWSETYSKGRLTAIDVEIFHHTHQPAEQGI